VESVCKKDSFRSPVNQGAACSVDRFLSGIGLSGKFWALKTLFHTIIYT